LDLPVQRRILEAIGRLAATGQGDVRPLQGRAGEYRLRVGDWRVIFSREAGLLVILILRVQPRGDAYRG
jgi:mRNA interferase RelE/StbE